MYKRIFVLICFFVICLTGYLCHPQDSNGTGDESGNDWKIQTGPGTNFRAIHMGGMWGLNKRNGIGFDELPDEYFEWLRDINVNWVGVTISLHVDHSMDSTVECKYTDKETDPETGVEIPTIPDGILRALIRKFKNHGFNVYLTLSFDILDAESDPNYPFARHQLGKPILTEDDSNISSDYWPWAIGHPNHASFVSEFWETYTEQAVHFATIAQDEGVSLYSLGTETECLFRTRSDDGTDWPNNFRTQLESMVSAVRNVYKGELTYDMHSAFWENGDFYKIGSEHLWEDLGLDVIGISAYFKLCEEEPTDVTELHILEDSWKTIFEDWIMPLKKNNPDRKIIFLEFGYVDTIKSPITIADGSFEPREFIDNNNNERDDGEETQNNIYRALFNKIDANPGVVEGAFLWGNDMSPNETWANSFGLLRTTSIRNKLVEDTVKERYAKWRGGAGSDREPVDIVLVLDYSGSMKSAAEPGGDRIKIEVLKDALEMFLKIWEEFAITEDRVDIVYFRSDVSPPTINLQPLVGNVETLIAEVRGESAGGCTAMGGALHTALTGLHSTPDKSHPTVLLFTNGMQNVNPMVVQDGSDYKIKNIADPRCGTSNISGDPDTFLSSYDIPVHIIAIGEVAATPYHEVLKGIAGKTSGKFHLTTKPDEDLRRFYTEDLVEALNFNTLEMVDYSYGTHSQKHPIREDFVMDGAVTRAVFLVHWMGNRFPGIKIDGPYNKDLQPIRWVNGNFYRMACFDFPYVLNGREINPVGTWRIYTEESGQTIPYQATLLVDESVIHYNFDLSRERYWTGDPIVITAKVTESGVPIRNLTSVKTTLTYPKTPLGTLLSTKPGTASSTLTDLHSTRGYSKLLKLLENPLIRKLLEPGKIVLELYDDGKSEHGDSRKGDGIYSTKLENTMLPGLYSFTFKVEGKTLAGWPIKRTQIRSAIVRVRPDLDNTRKTARWIKKSADGSGTALVTVIPYDGFENYLGPDYGDAFRFSKTYGNIEGKIYDALDGSYEIKLHLPDRSQDPTIDLSVLGFDVYKGPLSKLLKVTERFGLSAHFGITIPAGDFNLFYYPDISFGYDFELLLNNYLSLEALFGYHMFRSDTLPDIYWTNFSGNLKWFLNTRRIRPFVNGGGGFYKTNNNSTVKFGFNVGGGIAVQVRPTIYIESCYNYHKVLIGDKDDIQFSIAQFGLRFRF
jgi:hypothetical protein